MNTPRNNLLSNVYFLHGTSTSSSVWQEKVQSGIREVFGHKSARLVDWSGANNTRARKEAAQELIHIISADIERIESDLPAHISLVGHSHGGTIIFYASQEIRNLLGPEAKVNVLTLNTPNVVGGALLEDHQARHFHVYCRQDKVIPRAGFNRSGKQEKGGEKKSWLGRPLGGEFSLARDFGSGKTGSTYSIFEGAHTNIAYNDQYQFKGLVPRTHLMGHRGWLPKNVAQWLPQLAQAVEQTP